MPLAAFPKCFLDDLCVRRTMSVEAWIDLAAQLGVDGLEFYWGFTPHDDADALERLRARAARHGLSIPMMCYSPDFTTPDATMRAAEVDRQTRALETTAALGGRYCRVLSGQRRPEVARADGVQWTVDAITSLLAAAERCGVTMVLENHFKDGYWMYPEFAQRADVFLEILDAIPASPSFGVNYDPSNALIAGDDPIELLDRVKHRVVTMHASDRRLREGAWVDPSTGTFRYEDLVHGVIGTGSIDYDAVFQILQGVGFTGWISIEDGDDPADGFEHLQASARFLRTMMARYGVG